MRTRDTFSRVCEKRRPALQRYSKPLSVVLGERARSTQGRTATLLPHSISNLPIDHSTSVTRKRRLCAASQASHSLHNTFTGSRRSVFVVQKWFTVPRPTCRNTCIVTRHDSLTLLVVIAGELNGRSLAADAAPRWARGRRYHTRRNQHDFTTTGVHPTCQQSHGEIMLMSPLTNDREPLVRCVRRATSGGVVASPTTRQSMADRTVAGAKHHSYP
jgi:hypothetical protein